MKWVLVVVFMAALVLIPLPVLAYGDQGVYRTPSTSGQYYEMPYRLVNGTLVSLSVDLDARTITARIDEQANGVLELNMPPDLGNKFAIGTVIAFADEQEVQFSEILSCEYRTLVIPVSEGTEQIDIVGGLLAGSYQSRELPHNLSGNVNGQWYSFEVFTNSTLCGWEFRPEQKILQLQVASGNHTAISVPSAYLGGPLAASFSSDNVEYRIEKMDYGSGIVFEYDGSAEPLTVNIMGTTAIPEFGPVVMVIASLAVVGMLSAVRLARGRGFGVP